MLNLRWVKRFTGWVADEVPLGLHVQVVSKGNGDFAVTAAGMNALVKTNNPEVAMRQAESMLANRLEWALREVRR